MNYYLAAKLLWNPDLNPQAVLDVASARTYDNYYRFNPLDKLREIEKR